MARYSLIRGWIECEYEDIQKIKDIVLKHWKTAPTYQLEPKIAELYEKGWVFPSAPINWISLIFYGGNISNTALIFLKDCFIKISKSGTEINGFFYVDDEEGIDLFDNLLH